MDEKAVIGLSMESPMEELEKGLKEQKGFATYKKISTISTNQTLQSSQELNHQPKSTHGGIHGSSHICNRGRSYQASMGEEAFGPVKAKCLSAEE
jgi:hypothetical protein